MINEYRSDNKVIGLFSPWFKMKTNKQKSGKAPQKITVFKKMCKMFERKFRCCCSFYENEEVQALEQVHVPGTCTNPLATKSGYNSVGSSTGFTCACAITCKQIK